MLRLLAICRNTFLQTIRQPIFSVLILLTFVFLVFNLPLSGWTMSPTGDHKESDQRLMNNVSLSTILAMGLLVAAFGSASVLAREIADRTALTVMAKPVSRATFVLGKYLGVAAAVSVAFYLCSLAFLMTVRHGVTPAAVDPVDWPVVVLGCSMLGLALLIALAGNWAFGWAFTSAVVFSATVCLTAAMAAITVIGKGWALVPFGHEISSQLLLALLLLFVGVQFFSAVAVAASTRLGQIPTLLVCIVVALLGAYYPLLFDRWADENVVIRGLGWIAPDTQYFMLMDALTMGREVPSAFVATSIGYGLCAIGGVLAIGVALFQTRQLEGQETASQVPAPIATLAWLGRGAAIGCVLAAVILPGWEAHRDLVGWATAIALLIAGAAGWILWGLFARGASWTYWLVLAAGAVTGLSAAAGLIWPSGAAFVRTHFGQAELVVRTLLGALLVLLCVLPRSRRHFSSTAGAVAAP